jgi:hypothetical protein
VPFTLAFGNILNVPVCGTESVAVVADQPVVTVKLLPLVINSVPVPIPLPNPLRPLFGVFVAAAPPSPPVPTPIVYVDPGVTASAEL